MEKILSVFGTRPEAINMTPVVRQLAQKSNIEARICVTTQRHEMLDQILNFFISDAGLRMSLKLA